MKVIDIVKLSNRYLAGEQLTYAKLLPFLDEVIDDINSSLNSKYPSFTSLGISANPLAEDVYDAFPDNYIRSVVCIGVASKYYTMDEEGLIAAEGYDMQYAQNLFYMTRDYIEQVPEEYRSDSTGGVLIQEDMYVNNYLPFEFDVW